MVNDYNAKKRTIALSDATGSGRNALFAMLNVPKIGASWPNKPESLGGNFPRFEWLSSNEDSPGNRAAYMVHLEKHVELPSNYSFADMQRDRTLLNSEIRRGEET